MLAYRVEGTPTHRSATLPLGRPLPNARMVVLDRGGQPVPVGVPGELFIGGRGVTRGYLERPALTAVRVAVAAGGVPLAHGNDGMGSLRLPAAACGLVTLKPGLGVVHAGIGRDDWSGMAENGALATTVADLAVAHAVLAGEQPGPLPELFFL